MPLDACWLILRSAALALASLSASVVRLVVVRVALFGAAMAADGGAPPSLRPVFGGAGLVAWAGEGSLRVRPSPWNLFVDRHEPMSMPLRRQGKLMMVRVEDGEEKV